jgi:hypothetical protein
MSNIKEEMPLLARHEGEWEGVYTEFDPDGNIIDRHQSHLSCTFPESGPYPYYQINRYTWKDGKTEEHHFPATFHDGRIWFDTERIDGSAWQADDKTILLYWERKGMPNVTLHEMIHLSDDGNHRSRTWHWCKDGVLFKRTIIKEQRMK